MPFYRNVADNAQTICSPLSHQAIHRGHEARSHKSWDIHHDTLFPTRKCLEQKCRQFAQVEQTDSLVRFEFPNSSGQGTKLLTIHRSVLIANGGALKNMVTSGFKEANSNTVTIYDSFEVWLVIRRYLYCLPFSLDTVNPELVMVAHRYELTELLLVCFSCIQLSHKWNGKDLVSQWLGVVTLIQPPLMFRRFFALQFSLCFESIAHNLRETNWKVGFQNVWKSLCSWGMLAACVKCITYTSENDQSEMLLDILFDEVESEVSDEDVCHILNSFDWESSAFAKALEREVARKWSQRAWRLLCLSARCTLIPQGFDVRARLRVAASAIDQTSACCYKRLHQSVQREVGLIHVVLRVYTAARNEEGTDSEAHALLLYLDVSCHNEDLRQYVISANMYLTREPCTCRMSAGINLGLTERLTALSDDAPSFRHGKHAVLLDGDTLARELRPRCTRCGWVIGTRLCFRKRRSHATS
eukprot:TRINITY_DN55486_c0_g1_i1.p1 TRINITY_DN55486_c0_g1~~TRINITY_DN55486_c0_g1_i1.p1  ORF type:complete len:471 (+),score=45.11 TRINITY_DN55486_c0_g1_i1:1713-3125(+)